MFEGSEHYPGDFFKHLQRLGANINGSTSSDRTNYFVDIPKAHVERVLAMESDRMAHLVPALDESKLNIQKGVVKNEYRQNYANRPYGMVWPILAEALYPPQHPYSWMTIGVMEDLDSASLSDVSAFFQRYYVPANASLAMVGDIDVDDMQAYAERYFGPIAGGSRAIRPWTPDPSAAKTSDLTLQDRVELDRFYAVWHTVPQFHDDDAPLSLLGDILGRGKASRLYRKLVIDRQVAQDVIAYQSGRELAGTFGITATLRPGHSIAEARDIIDDEIRSIASGGVTEEELDAGPDDEDREFPLRTRAHRRVRRRRRSAQRLQHLPRRPIADHHRPGAIPGSHCRGRPVGRREVSRGHAQGHAVGRGEEGRGGRAAAGPQGGTPERPACRVPCPAPGDPPAEQRNSGLGVAPA